MNPMSEWLQDNWYDFGSLLAQLSIAVILAWYGREALRILKAAKAPEAQQEPSRKLSLLDVLGSRPEERQVEAAPVAAPREPIIGRIVDHGVAWLQAPMRNAGVNPFRRVVRWFQAPIGS
jgi:hypothetical protein